MKFAGAIHRVINLPYLIHSSLDVLRYGFQADDMTVVKDRHGLQIFRIVGRTCLLMTQQDRLYVRWQCFAQAVSLGDPQRNARGATGKAVSEVEAICQQVDRLPLAIELAAMHVKLLPLSELQKRLTHRLTLLRDGARDLPKRQQTMENAIAWSYELLTEEH